MLIEDLLYYVFSLFGVISAIMVISARNPVHSVFFLILVFINTSAILLMLQADFLALIFIVVYVGAIAVLFLFVVMMLNIRLVELHENVIRYLPIGGIIGILFFLEIYIIISAPQSSTANIISGPEFVDWVNYISTSTNIEALGYILYTHYFLYFIIAGIILLVAMIGAIILTLSDSTYSMRQNISHQLQRTSLF